MTYASHLADTSIFLIWALETGGLRSPILPVQLLLGGAMVLLFPRPTAALPAVAALALVAWMDRGDGGGHVYDLTLLATYGSLHLALAFLLTSLDRRERALLTERDLLMQELAAAGERARLSREIHDGVGGSVAALVLQAQVMEGLVEEGPAKEQGRLLYETSSEALEELRRSLRLMRDEFDLLAAAKDHCLRFEKRTGLPVALALEGDATPFPPETQLSLFRLLQEALTNVVRHAKASSVRVSLSLRPGYTHLEIQDDGVGFSTRERRPGSYGLRGFEERAAQLGGTLAIESLPGQGTRVRFSLPHMQETAR